MITFYNSKTQTIMEQSAMKEYITNAMISLRDKGYMTLDLIKLGIYTAEEIQEMQDICMSEYYKYFTDRGLKLADIKIDLTKKLEKNPYFRQGKDSPMFKAMYGHKSKDGREYINTRVPANATNCGMGQATSQKSTYYHERLNEQREKLRPLMKSLYGEPVKRHLTRFGLKLPPSKDMQLHTDMSYIEANKNNPPKMRDADDPVAYHPFAQNGRFQRLQMTIGLNNSEAGWYGYEGAHLQYDNIGDKLGWPGKTRTIQKISPKIMKDLGLKRVNIPSKFGQAIIWNCGLPHGNTPCKEIPRLTLYVNYQPDTTDTVADRIIGLGNQPNEKKSTKK